MLALSDKWVPVLLSQPETGMNYQIASIRLKDGRQFDHVLISGGYVARIGDAPDIPFEEDDIESIVVNHGK